MNRGTTLTAALFPLALATAAGCGHAVIQPPPPIAARPTVPREAFDARSRPERPDPMLLRLDDLAPSAQWAPDPREATDAPDRVWEFDDGAQGWTLTDSSDPEATGGRVRWTVAQEREGLISPEMDVPFRELREIEIRMRASAGTRLRLWWAERKASVPGTVSGFRRHLMALRGWWAGNNRFDVKYAIASEIVPGENVLRYSVKTSSLRGYEGMRLAWLRLDPTDGAPADVEIESIRLVGREGSYAGRGHGIAQETLDNQVRNVLFHRAPATASWELNLPPAARFDVGAGLLQGRDGATFVASIEHNGKTTEVLRETVVDDTTWHDLTADLSKWAGKKVRLTLGAESAVPGQIILWSNPMIAPDPAAARALFARGRAERPPNVILYLIDTLRSDHLSAYGHANETSPIIDAFAREGALFERVSAAAPWTRPAVSSILTSLAPPSHGVTNYGLAMSDAVTTLAEVLRKRGYVTAGFIASTQSGSSANLQQGYDFLNELPVISGGEEIEIANPGQVAGRSFNKTSAGINKALLPWLETHGQKPFFLYLHVMDPHAPYSPPAPFDTMFDGGYTGPLKGIAQKASGFKQAKTPEEMAYVRALYDGDIRFNDARFGELLEALRKIGRLDDTVFVVTSDHGEEFQEHGHWEHGRNLHRETVDVPWIVRYPPGVPAGVRITKRVSSLDVMPTLLDAAGVALSPDYQGKDRLPLVRKAAADLAAGADDGEMIFIWRQGDGEAEQVAVEQSGIKLIWLHDGARELYDHASDRGETNDLASARGALASELEEHGRAWLASRFRITTPGEAVRVTIDEEERKWLEALGYIK